MKHTPETLKDLRDAIDAHLAGKLVQYNTGNGVWIDCNPPNPTEPKIDGPAWIVDYYYRPKPEPKTRPWSKPDDVPGPVCWPRYANEVDQQSMIIGVDEFGVTNCTSNDGMIDETWGELHDQEYSTDRKTWQPCVVTE